MLKRGPLPCWFDRWHAERHAADIKTLPTDPRLADVILDTGSIEPAEVYITLIIPAYNEEDRILPTLHEAVAYLDETFGRPSGPSSLSNPSFVSATKKRNLNPATTRRRIRHDHSEVLNGYEILVVDDGSRDRTVDVCLEFSRRQGLHEILRVIKLEKNRGKGGAVTHGMRHARGEYILFADADGATKFSDMERLMDGCEEVVDGFHRGVAIGSRAHLVGSEAVVKVCLSATVQTVTSSRS